MFESSLKMIQDAISNGAFPCAAVAIGCKDQVLVSKCFGTITYEKESIPCTPELLFDLASLSKVVSTTMIALRLMEQGLLSLDDTLSLFFTTNSSLRDITLRQLMTHTSGISSHFLLEEEPIQPKIEDIILSHALSYVPGTKVEYSCMGYILLGRILEIVTGDTLDVLAKKEVFEPLHMNSTCYQPKALCVPTEKKPSCDEYFTGIVHDENARFLNGVSGNAGVFSSLTDMIHFAKMLACNGALFNKQYLQNTTLCTALYNYTNGLNENRGLGFKLVGGEGNFFGDLFSPHTFGHTGFTGTSLAVEPETGLYIVLLTNRVHPTRNNNAVIRFRRLLHNRIATEWRFQ